MKYLFKMELKLLQQISTLTLEEHFMLLLSIKLPQHLLTFSFNYLENIYAKAPHYCPTIFIGDFSVNMLENISSSKQLPNYMQQHQFVLTFPKSTTIYKSQFNHI
jgi:hypothetical protein